jgi:hypothetical protein
VQQSFGSPPVAVALHQSIEHEAILVNGAPKLMLFAIDGDGYFIEMPLVAELRCAPLNGAGKIPTKFLSPAPNRFMAHDKSAGRQQISDHPQTEWEPEIEPHGM